MSPTKESGGSTLTRKERLCRVWLVISVCIIPYIACQESDFEPIQDETTYLFDYPDGSPIFAHDTEVKRELRKIIFGEGLEDELRESLTEDYRRRHPEATEDEIQNFHDNFELNLMTVYDGDRELGTLTTQQWLDERGKLAEGGDTALQVIMDWGDDVSTLPHEVQMSLDEILDGYRFDQSHQVQLGHGVAAGPNETYFESGAHTHFTIDLEIYHGKKFLDIVNFKFHLPK